MVIEGFSVLIVRLDNTLGSYNLLFPCSHGDRHSAALW